MVIKILKLLVLLLLSTAATTIAGGIKCGSVHSANDQYNLVIVVNWTTHYLQADCRPTVHQILQIPTKDTPLEIERGRSGIKGALHAREGNACWGNKRWEAFLGELSLYSYTRNTITIAVSWPHPSISPHASIHGDTPRGVVIRLYMALAVEHLVLTTLPLFLANFFSKIKYFQMCWTCAAMSWVNCDEIMHDNFIRLHYLRSNQTWTCTEGCLGEQPGS